MTSSKNLSTFYLLTYLDGFLFALMVATTESYALFYLAKQGVTGIELGILSTLPILLAALSQLVVPRMIPTRYIGRALLIFILIQGAGLWGIFSCFSHSYSFIAILISLSLYWWGGQSAGPFWVDLVSQNISAEKFARYFSTRNMFVVFSTMALFIFFSQFSSWNVPFQYLFLTGFIARLLSFSVNFILLRKYPAVKTERAPVTSSVRDELKAQPQILRQVILWGGFFRFSVSICSAFFLIYMVKDLALSTPAYVILCAAPFFGRALFQRNWVHASKNEKVYHGIQIATGLIALIPWLWTLSSNYYYLIFLQILSGLLWGGMELTHLLVAQMHTYGSARRLLGIQQAVFGSFSVLGAVLGGWLIERHWPITQIFDLSSLLRLMTATILLYKLRQFSITRLSVGNSYQYLGTLLSIRPSLANIMRLIPVDRRTKSR